MPAGVAPRVSRGDAGLGGTEAAGHTRPSVAEPGSKPELVAPRLHSSAVSSDAGEAPLGLSLIAEARLRRSWFAGPRTRAGPCLSSGHCPDPFTSLCLHVPVLFPFLWVRRSFCSPDDFL